MQTTQVQDEARALKVRLLISSLALTAGRAKFASLTYASKQSGEVARHTLIIGANYNKVVQESLLELEIMLPTLTGIKAQACDELMESFKKTLEAHARGEQNEDYTKKGLYRTLCTGLQCLDTDGTLEICGLSHAKAVITPGVFKEVKSRPLTIAKNELRALTRAGKWRTFCLDAGNLNGVRLNGETLELE